MKAYRFSLMLFALAIVLIFCIGCDSEIKENQREVSKTFVGFSKSGLEIANGDLKESGAVFEDTVVEFQDPVIEEMLRTILGILEGDVYRSDLRKIHAIYYRMNGYFSDLQSADGNLPPERTEWYLSGDISSLEDLALCDNLQWLEFGSRQLPSLEPLQRLPQLEHISFHSTVLSRDRLEELVRLPALNSLDLDLRAFSANYTETGTENDTTGDGTFILPLADQLTFLEVDHKMTWPPEILAQLTKLEYLSIDAPEDLCFIASMPNLTHLHVANYDQDWSGLSKAESLVYLALTKCEGITLDDVRPLVNLEQLNLTMTNFTPVAWKEDVIEALPSLTGFCLQ